MYTRKTALGLAIQARTCPLKHIVNDPAYARQNKDHLAICPFCSTHQSEELDACRSLADALEHRTTTRSPGTRELAPGQIWQINPALACWRDRFYYSPPAVVILQVPESNRNHVLTAQIWHDIFLAGPGDLVVSPEGTPWDQPVFIETWNIYTLTEPYLTHFLGHITPAETADILKMNQEPDYLPFDTTALLPLEENDPRHYFRKMEIEVGYTFAQSAAHDLMDEPPVKDVTALMEQIQHLIPGASFSWTPDSVEECFALLEFPPESLAMAAADQEYKKIAATHFHLTPDPEKNLVTRITPFYCVIYNETNTSTGYTVSGTLADLQFDLGKTRFSCYLADIASQTLEKGTIRIDPENHAFFATFLRPKTPSEALCILADENQGTEP